MHNKHIGLIVAANVSHMDIRRLDYTAQIFISIQLRILVCIGNEDFLHVSPTLIYLIEYSMNYVKSGIL